MLPPASSSTTFSNPIVHSPARAQLFKRQARLRSTRAAPPRAVAQIRLGRTQVVPVGFRLDADALDGHELAVDAEQPLDDVRSDCS